MKIFGIIFNMFLFGGLTVGFIVGVIKKDMFMLSLANTCILMMILSFLFTEFLKQERVNLREDYETKLVDLLKREIKKHETR